ncbi:MAG TPA: hypothetical protein VNH11_26980 [Pirellulales bacterium]|nr:hypothetical protein [Pirellulales bacterium]
MGQADHDYRYAAAQAVYDLAVNGDAATYVLTLGLAAQDRADAENLAVSTFETTVDPAVVQQATDDANAIFTQAQSQASAVLDDTLTGDQQEHDYAHAEAADYDIKLRADAQALDDYQAADANGHAAAIAAFAQANPSPWANLAAAQALAQAGQQVADAGAQLTRSQASADAQESADQARADAQKASDDAGAQADYDQAIANAQGAQEVAIAQGDLVDAVFSLLPDVLQAPDDGTPLSLTPDFNAGYEANDFYLRAAGAQFDYGGVAVIMSPLERMDQAASLMPEGLGLTATPPYGSFVHGSQNGWEFGPATLMDIMPWGEFNGAPQRPITIGDTSGADEIIAGGGASFSEMDVFHLRDPDRGNFPIVQNYQTAMHFTGANAMVVRLADASGGNATGTNAPRNSLWNRITNPGQWFYVQPQKPPLGPPSTGGGVGANNNDSTDPGQSLLSKIYSRGAMTPRSGQALDNQDIKNSIKFGNFPVAIYEGIADALEEQIWNLATFGILGEAEAELVSVAAKRSWYGVRNIVKITVGKVAVWVGPDEVAKIKKVLKNHNSEPSIDDVVKALQGFSEKRLKQAVDEAVERMCFAPDTLVSTESGLRPIGEVQIGQRVHAFDFATGQWALSEVLKRHDNTYSGWMVTLRIGESTIKVTANHPFWVIEGQDLGARSTPSSLGADEDQGPSLPGRWVDSQDLRPRDWVASLNGAPARVETVGQRVQHDIAVCNLTVAGHHTFAVGEGGVLVHNNGWCDSLELLWAKPEKLVEMRKALIAAGEKGGLLHAHHIVMKKIPEIGKRSEKVREAIKASHKILADADINLFDNAEKFADFAKNNKSQKAGAENFAWALSRKGYDLHSDEYALEVYRRLDAASRKGKAALKEELAWMRNELENGRSFWDKK